MNKKLLLPIAFFALAAVLYFGLFRDPREVPSPLIGKPAPAFTLETLDNPAAKFSPADMKGKVWLLNVWASWCPNCKDEHPDLMDLKRRSVVPIIGLNYKDKRELGLDVLRKTGDPYTVNAFDPGGKAALDWGVYGAPETFLIDRDGIIRAKHVGPISPEIFATKFASFLK
ncbi:DsbE family thiol:disulfide interchange protein [Casimicrobium huifangae]|uniref:DsbE family thiol:disulfide interchange protein n=1 Tax=Casimicrobium huifangae TaxID=2591109 RepID=UPI0012EB9BCB|nr:DsbE family thiol:disulfide interchange protein [Casimicrobium huifangae]